MKYLILGPGAMGIFSLVGFLKRNENSIENIEEISSSSCGSILGLLLCLGFSIDEIFNKINIDLKDTIKFNIKSFINSYGVIDIQPIKEKLVDICGCDPTFDELNKVLYISAYCLDTSKIVYFSKHTHPKMKVIDAVCMSISIPFLLPVYEYNGYKYIDGATKERIPTAPFLDKIPHEVFIVRLDIKKTKINLDSHKGYILTLVDILLENRDLNIIKYSNDNVINIEDIDVYNFNMSYETKLQLYYIGYNTT